MGYDVAFPVAAVVVQVQSFKDLVAAARSRVLRVRRVGVADVRQLMQDCRFSKTSKTTRFAADSSRQPASCHIPTDGLSTSVNFTDPWKRPNRRMENRDPREIPT